MKTKLYYLGTKLFVAILFIVILVAKTNASEAPKLKVIPYANVLAMVTVDNTENTFSELTIENASGNIVFYREGRINAENYSKIFDLKNLRNGDYKIIVSNKYGKHEAGFSVLNNEILVEKNTPINPYFNFTGSVLNLSALNHASNNLYFILENNNEGVIYTKPLGSKFNITTGFNLEKLSSGTYTAKLSDGNKSYSYTFEK